MFFFFQAEDGIRDRNVTGVQTCAPSDLSSGRTSGSSSQSSGAETGACGLGRMEYAEDRSEERRVGKEWRWWGGQRQVKKKKGGTEGRGALRKASTMPMRGERCVCEVNAA